MYHCTRKCRPLQARRQGTSKVLTGVVAKRDGGKNALFGGAVRRRCSAGPSLRLDARNLRADDIFHRRCNVFLPVSVLILSVFSGHAGPVMSDRKTHQSDQVEE